MKLLKSVLIGTFCFAAAPLNAAPWVEWPPGPRDWALEAVVRAAYVGAVAHARSNLNYFARDDDFDALRGAIETELARQGWGTVDVPVEPADDLAGARKCSPAGITLRIGVNMFGDGLDLAAASTKRVFSYHYDPREDEAIVVAPSEECVK